MSSTITTALPALPTPRLSIPSGPVTAPLHFFLPPADGSRAEYLVDGSANGSKPVENFGSSAIPTTLTDIRGSESAVSLPTHAFAALKSVPSDPTINWDSDTSIREKYYPEVQKLLLDTAGGSKVIIFDHTVRLADPQAHREPVLSVHVDQTAYSAAQRVRRHSGGDSNSSTSTTSGSTEETQAGEELIKSGVRYRIINVWRPLTRGPVASYPLAFASVSPPPSSSATDNDPDIVPIRHVYPNGYIGEHAGVKHNPLRQQWHYWSGMTTDERLLLQCFDSSVGEKGGRTPHTAFVDPRTPEDAEPRRSIEVRALVFG